MGFQDDTRVARFRILRHPYSTMRLFLLLLLILIWDSAAVAMTAPRLIAHRGASHDAPENTLAAIQLAWKQGADGVEVDLHLTKDNHVVCIHDPDTRSVANRRLVVRESTLEELQALDVGSKHDAKFRGERIPTLQEVLGNIPEGKFAYLDLKAGPEIVAPLLRILNASQLDADQIVFLAFDDGLIRKIKSTAPQYKVQWLCRVRKTPILGTLRPSLDSILATLHESGADGLASRHSDVSDEFIRSILGHGFEHHVWTVNNPEQARRFHQLGTRSIITSSPAELRNIFETTTP